MYHELNRHRMLPVRLPTEQELLSVLQATHNGYTIADLAKDLRSHRWHTPAAFAWCFGFDRLTAPTFCNGVLKFLQWRDSFGRRWMDERAWLRCFAGEVARGL